MCTENAAGLVNYINPTCELSFWDRIQYKDNVFVYRNSLHNYMYKTVVRLLEFKNKTYLWVSFQYDDHLLRLGHVQDKGNIKIYIDISITSWYHYSDVIMSTMASLITSLTSVYPTVHPGANQRTHQSSASLAFVRGIHRRSVNFPHKWPVTRKMFPFDDVIMMAIIRGIGILHLLEDIVPFISH